MIDTGTPLVRVHREGPTAWVTLNRAEKLNALNREILNGLDRALTEIEQAAVDGGQVRVIVITGAGTRAFCAGADLKQVKSSPTHHFHPDNMFGHRVIARLRTTPLPVIAAINGVALGGGLELALACDLRLAAAHARFALPEVGVGVMPGWGGTWRLAEAVGAAKARELVLTGESINAVEAARIGLISSVQESEAALLKRVAELADQLAKNSPVSMAHAKTMLNANENPAGMRAAAETGYVASLLGTEFFALATAKF